MGHDHSHDAPRARSGRAFLISVALNALVVAGELVAGLVSGSMALVADAAHNFGDVLGLALAWGASYLATRRPTARRTYGLRRTTILASLANALLLVLGVGAVSWEAVERLGTDVSPPGGIVIAVAAVGFVVNACSAALFLRGGERDANLRGAFLHLAADAAVSLGVVVAGVVMLLTGWSWVDPVVSLLVSVAILGSTWSLLRTSVDLALDAVPAHVDPAGVRAYLGSLPHVRGVHHVHIWATSTTETALTAHLVLDDAVTPPDAPWRGLVADATRGLSETFGIGHVTLQLEPHDAPASGCASASDDCSAASESPSEES